MHFSRLRLSGFKSFVEPTEFHIEPGLTGVVGPNGCGKSNLLEALRWVMGANSAKAMRGEGMDDVIFSGSGARPGRNHAEVTLTVENPGAGTPVRWAGEPALEVTRRIDRGAGSTYRINGVEVRARDVQLLFADASTGANSPALVRQGQISELIAARPQNRRRILEEAAGVSGLYGRRHEAQLRVRAAEANLLRLDDLARELESGLGRLRREARTAARYKKLATEIRGLQSAVLHARWTEAVAALEAARVHTTLARTATEIGTREAANAAAAALNAQDGLPALRDEAVAAAAVLNHLAIEKDRTDRALENAQADLKRLKDQLGRIAGDLERESRTALDAAGALSRLQRDLAQVESEIAAAPERTPELEAAARTADVARTGAETALEAAAAQVAAAQAEARTARSRLEEARTREARITAALNQATAERRSLGSLADPALMAAEAALAGALQALTQAREDLEATERLRAEAALAESQTRIAARATEDELGRKLAEARGLARLTPTTARGGFAAVLDQISTVGGLEAALSAALGDDLTAALDPRASSFWAGHDGAASLDPPIWPPGVTPLAPSIIAPAQLAVSLALTGLVDRADGARLQAQLPPGARLVSQEGDLWRWDGFTVKAEAPRPAQVRLEQRSRLTALEAEIAALQPAAATAKATLEEAAARLAGAEQAVKLARARPRPAELEVARARDAVERLRAEQARREARAQTLDETLDRLAAEHLEATSALQDAEIAVAALAPDAAGADWLTRAREAAARAREIAFAARAAFDRETAARSGRARRLESLRRDHADWTRRAGTAAGRQTELEKEREQAAAKLDEARRAPEAIEARRALLLDEAAGAEARKSRADDALTVAETARADADRAARAADARAADAREARASAEARLEAALTRVDEQALAIREASGLEPADLGQKLAEDAVAAPTGVAGAETHLAALERERDALGAVNLLAEDEAAELSSRLGVMANERADLSGALARLGQAIEELNAEGRERLMAAFEVIDSYFRDLFTTLFQGGAAELRLVESADPLEAGLEILACPPGKRMAVMSLMSGGEQALTAVALIFAVFLANPAPICVLDEVDAPLDDANVERFCDLLAEMRRRASTRFLTITHNPLTMSRMDRLFGVTMRERGVSQLVSVDLRQAEALAAQ